jgi:hypothetical protein
MTPLKYPLLLFSLRSIAVFFSVKLTELLDEVHKQGVCVQQLHVARSQSYYVAG